MLLGENKTKMNIQFVEIDTSTFTVWFGKGWSFIAHFSLFLFEHTFNTDRVSGFEAAFMANDILSFYSSDSKRRFLRLG